MVRFLCASGVHSGFRQDDLGGKQHRHGNRHRIGSVQGPGDGDSDGSEEKPYTTLAAAAAKVNAGDTIYIRKGKYVPAAQVDLAKGITISGAPGTTRDEVVLGDVTGYNVLTLRGAFTVANLTIANVGVSNNEPGYGGAIRFNSSTEASVVSNCVFRNCKTAWQAGAINVQSPVTVVDCVFENNETAYEGDTPSTAYKSNYALSIGSGVAGAVENCTFKQNVLYTSSGSVVKMVNGTVRNCLFVANERGWNLISDQTGGSVSGGATVEANFCEPDIAQAQFEEDGVTPQKDWAEVINKGVKKDWMTGAKDLLGRARVSGGRVDIGAVERQFFSGLKLLFR